MNNQEFFDKAVAHLRKQGRRASNSQMGCRYRIEVDGVMLACAVGGVMPDDLAREVIAAGLNGSNIHNVRLEMRQVDELFAGVDESLMGAVQDVHDCFEPESWENRFLKVAQDFELTYTPPAQETPA